MGTFALQLSGASKRHDGAARPVFRDLSLEIERGELLVLLGPSGCGKSTLLACLAGLDSFSTGSLTFASGQASVGVVFQEPRLMPWLNVRENVALGLGYRRNRQVRAQVDPTVLLDEVGLSELADAWPDQLSGGQAQRVNLARSIATRPDILLLDEPFAALDPHTRADLGEWLLQYRGQHSLTGLLVTHDLDEALRLADRVLLMTGKDGALAAWPRAAWANGATAEVRAQILSRFERSPRAASQRSDARTARAAE